MLRWYLSRQILLYRKKSTYHVSLYTWIPSFWAHEISLTLLSQDSTNESISPLHESSPYLLKTQIQERHSKKKKEKKVKKNDKK